MVQRFLSTLASTSLVAGLAAAGVVTAAAPAAAVEPATNPTLQGCGIPITLVLDASSSINDTEQGQVRTAANAFLDGLDNTNSTSRVLQFSGTSANISFPRRPISSVTPPNPSNLALTKTEIQTKYHNEQGYVYPGTNWESALWFTNQPVNETQNGLVVFITDGDPTRVGTTTSTDADPGPATEAAIPKANDLKALGNRVLAVGVGTAITNDSRERLKKVSGPTLVTSVPANSTINAFDVLVSETFAGLEQSLKNVASSLCGGAITIQKLTDSGPDGTYVPTSGWNIGAEVVGATNPEDFTWTTPVNNTDESVSGTTAVAPTLPGDPAKGTVQFQYRPKATWNAKNPTLRISETLQAKYNPRVGFGFRCEFPGSTRTPVQGDLTVANGKAQFDVPNITADQRLSCLIYNKHTTSTLRLRKTVAGGGTTADQWVMTATGPGNAPSYSKPGNHLPFESVWSGVEYQLGETAPAGQQDNYISGDWTCDKGVAVTGTNKDRITIPAGTTDVTCSITNTRKGELVVKKKTNPAGATQEFTFKPTGWNNNQNFPLTDGQEKSSGKIAPGQYSVEELVPTGWSYSVACVGSAVTQEGNKQTVTVPAGERVVCTFTNTKLTANLRLQKEVLGGGSGQKSDWLLSADAAAPFDGKDIDNVPGDNVAWAEVYAGVTYKLTESAGPGNYTPGDVWVCVTDDDAAAEVVNPGDEVSLAPGEFKTCTITNSRNLAQLKLVKQVSGGKAQADEFILTAKADAAEKQDRNISTPGGSGSFEDVYAQTEYTLGETGPGGYSPSDWACVSTPVEDEASVAVLNTGDKITLAKGDRVTCTIVNNRDLGSLTIIKSFNPKSSGYDKAFNISYQCTDEAKQTVSVKAGESKTITGIPTGSECIVSEVKPTDPPAGWSFSEPVYDPADGKVTVTRKDQDVSVTVTNEILKPGINIVKTASATQVNPGDIVTYTYTVTNPGDAELTDVKVSDDKCAPVTYQSGDTNADSKLQTSETWIYTCSQPITLATTNIGTATAKDKNGLEVSGQDSFTVAVVSPVVVKQICPIEPKLTTPKVKKVGNRVLVKKITTKKSSCVLLKPVVLCRPVASAAAGQTAFCRTTVTRKGFIKVNTKGYDKVRVTVLVRSKPKPDFTDRWKPSTWRKTWLLK